MQGRAPVSLEVVLPDKPHCVCTPQAALVSVKDPANSIYLCWASIAREPTGSENSWVPSPNNMAYMEHGGTCL